MIARSNLAAYQVLGALWRVMPFDEDGRIFSMLAFWSPEDMWSGAT